MTAVWVVIPAAGSGSRFHSETPKQYHYLANGLTVLEQTLACFSARADVAGIIVSVAENDAFITTLKLPEKTVLVTGGSERFLSVKNALAYIESHAGSKDLVAVHDAARPCVSAKDIQSVFSAASENPAGALLSLPCVNTVKRLQDNGQLQTENRQQLFMALTPQVFPFKLLQQALNADNLSAAITDDASAVERLGYSPTLVLGESCNIKITEPADLALANFYLQQGQKPPCE